MYLKLRNPVTSIRIVIILVLCAALPSLVPSLALSQTPKGISGECKADYRKWKKRGGAGAFATSRNGACGYSWDYSDIVEARSAALSACRARAKKSKCQVVEETKTIGPNAISYKECLEFTAPSAFDACERVIKIDPKAAFAYNNRGVLYERKGEFQKAVDDFKKAISLKVSNKKDAELYKSNLALAEEKLSLRKQTVLRISKMASPELCTKALTASREEWDTREFFRDFVSEAQRRKLSLGDCQREIVVTSAPTDNPSSLAASALCEKALDERNTTWGAEEEHVAYVGEAVRRGMTIEDCRRTLANSATAEPTKRPQEQAAQPCPSSVAITWHNCTGTRLEEDGSRYVGQFSSGWRHGYGTLLLSNGDEYVGEFNNNNMQGQGTYKSANGLRYVGEFKNNFMEGQGSRVWMDGSKQVGGFVYGKLTGGAVVVYANGDRYSGNYSADSRNGYGVYTWSDGSKYVGLWTYGLPKGGVHTNKQGDRIVGAQYTLARDLTSNGSVHTPPDVLSYTNGAVQKQKLPEDVGQTAQQEVNLDENLRKVALVIGNGKYRHATPLANPRNDAEAMSALLRGLGFEVVSGIDLDKRATESTIAEFVDRASQADISLFYYAGHGIQVGGENFIVPVDARVEKASSVDFELLNVNMVTDYMGGEKSVGIALLDACRDNPFTRTLSRALGKRSSQVSSGLAEIRSEGGGLLVGFATSPGDVADDGVGRKNSPFTTALLRHLGQRGLEIELLMKRVKADTFELTDGKQQPWHNSALRTEVYIAGR